MRSSQKTLTPAVCFWALLAACSADNAVREPKEMVDLGALVTEDLAERVWGKAALASLNFTRRNAFDVIEWEFETVGGTVTGSNAYYTLFNHGGPHVDAPNHYDFGGGLDSFSIEAFAGPLKVFDVRRFPEGYSVPPDVFDGSVSPGDVVLIFTGYTPPQTAEALPENITLTPAAAQYLVSIPVRAFGTDAQSVGSWKDPGQVEAETESARAAPVHHAFLSRGIPVYEQLFNVDRLVGKAEMYFVGVPLNIREGDGMLVRPVVFVY